MLPIFWPPILVLIILVASLFWFGWVFLYDIISLFINGVILYFIGLRANAEIQEGKTNLYISAAVLGLVIIAFSKNFLKGLLIWRFTTWIIVSFIIAQAVIIIHYYYKKKQKKK